MSFSLLNFMIERGEGKHFIETANPSDRCWHDGDKYFRLQGSSSRSLRFRPSTRACGVTCTTCTCWTPSPSRVRPTRTSSTTTSCSRSVHLPPQTCRLTLYTLHSTATNCCKFVNHSTDFSGLLHQTLQTTSDYSSSYMSRYKLLQVSSYINHYNMLL